MSAGSVAVFANLIGSSTMTDERPRPRYGEYAPVSPAVRPVPAPTPVVEAVVAPKPRSSWDVFLTTMLLLLGVIDVVTGFSQFSNLADTLRTTYASQGLPAFTADALANRMGVAINIARVAVLVAAVIFSLLLIRSNRRSFWVPLAAAAAGAIVVIVCVLVVIINDPALAQYISTHSNVG